jgi:hypothetical protein
MIIQNKKAQTEMMGLVILVVILLLGAVFYVKFAIIDKKVEVDTSLFHQRAFFIASAIAKVQIDGNLTLQEAVPRCDNDERDICDMIKQKIPEIVGLALGNEYQLGGKNGIYEGKLYAFNITKNGDITSGKEVVASGDCGDLSKTTASYPLPGSKGYNINYILCQ